MDWDKSKDGPEHAWHVGNGVFFARGPEGRVRCVLRDGPTDTTVMEVSETEWASIVAHVSKTGETAAAYYKALDFHQTGA